MTEPTEEQEMAATPKRSLKRTVASTVEERSPRFLLGSLALAMVISLLAGLGIGIKVGENNKSNNATPVAKTKPTTTKPKTATRPKNPLVGTIVGKTPQRIVVATRTGRVRARLIRNTVINVTTAATTADIKAGSHVLIALKPVAGAASAATTPTGLTSSSVSATSTTTKPGPLTASEIIIVTGTRKNRAGAPVSSVTANSMTFKLPNGRPLTISTAGARVVRTIPGKRVNLATGKHVLVQWFHTPPLKKAKNAKNAKKAPVRFRIALEIVVLPVATTFA
jgi:hypothetical protein